MKPFLSGPLLIIIAAFLWALDGVFRRTLYSLPPLVIVFLEHAIGTLILLPVLFKSVSLIRALTKKEWGMLLLISLLSSLLGTLWFTTALLKIQFIPFSVVFLLQKVQPVFVITAAALILKERITKQYIVWAFIAITSAYFVTFKNGMVNFATGAGTIEAAGFALAAAAAWGISTIFSKIALQTKPDLFVTTMRFTLTSILGLATLFIFGLEGKLTAVTPQNFFYLTLIALSTGMVALAIYYKGLAKTEAKVATILELVFPVTAVFIDIFLYKSVLEPSQYIAAGILLLAALRISYLQGQRATFISTRIKGKGRGKKIGVPTINLAIPKKLELRDGIYATYATVGSKTYKGALHYGPVPAFNEKKKSLEVFLLNTKSVSDSALKKPITIDVVSYIRPVMNFASPKALTDQVALDVQRVKSIL